MSSIDIPTDVDRNHKESPIKFALLTFSVTDGNGSATAHISGSLKCFNDLICKVISSRRAITLWDITLYPKDTLIVHLRVQTTNSGFSTSRDKARLKIGLTSSGTKAKVLPSYRRNICDRVQLDF